MTAGGGGGGGGGTIELREREARMAAYLSMCIMHVLARRFGHGAHHSDAAIDKLSIYPAQDAEWRTKRRERQVRKSDSSVCCAHPSLAGPAPSYTGSTAVSASRARGDGARCTFHQSQPYVHVRLYTGKHCALPATSRSHPPSAPPPWCHRAPRGELLGHLHEPSLEHRLQHICGGPKLCRLFERLHHTPSSMPKGPILAWMTRVAVVEEERAAGTAPLRRRRRCGGAPTPLHLWAHHAPRRRCGRAATHHQ